MAAGQVPLFALAVLALVFVLSVAYEFTLEEAFLRVLGIGDPVETTREHWRYVLSVTAFTAIALVAPSWALYRALVRRERMEAEIRRLASHDGLTGLPNRRLLVDRLEQAMLRARRDGTTVAVIFLDLDAFKAVNDAWGHKGGDEVLVLTAGRLSEAVRGTDTVARFGGDEFVVVMTDVTDPADVVAMAVKLDRTLARPYPLDGGGVSLRASIGVALYPEDATDVDALLTLADEAMYRAKGEGKSQYRFSGR